MPRISSFSRLGGLIFLVATIISVPFSRSAQCQVEPYAETLVRRAADLKLDQERIWEVLLHYAPTLVGGYKSRIDDPKFFLAPAGRTDKKAEMEATLRGLLESAKDGEHTACRFPARYDWLKERLAIDPAQLPPFSCSEKEKIFREIDPTSAVLVFPVGHINSPASMFGHTLLRIDGRNQSNLISYAANYAAVTDDSNGFVYAWKGLFGLYNGFYSITPYYMKVKEYNDLEHRDMWEYRLKFSEEEVRRMLNHIWELQNIHSPYFFFDENCSYNLLFLMESARPDLHLVESTGVFVLPTHTINIALKNGIVESPRYRPSQGTRIRKLLSLMDTKDQRLARDLALGTTSPDAPALIDRPDAERIKVLDLASEFVQYRLSRDEIDKDTYSKLYMKMLSARSLLGAAPDDLYKVEEPSWPETGHRTTRVALGGGVRRGEPYAEVNIQPEFHSMLDPDQGYLKGAQIKFLDTAIKYNLSTEQMQLKSLHVIDIFSIAPRDVFFKPLSWKVNTGLDREAMRNGRDHLIARLNTGGGLAWNSPFGGICYTFAEMDLNAGGGVRGKATVGPGLSIGDVEHLTEWWKIHLAARGFLYQLGDDRRSVKFSLGQNLRVSRNNSIRLEASQELVNGHGIGEATVLWNYYF